MSRDMLEEIELRDGRDGRRGPLGKAGRDGKPGERGAPGQPGERGPQGERGAPGRDGARGLDGTAAAAAEPPAPWHVTVEFNDSGRIAQMNLASENPNQPRWRVTPDWQAGLLAGALITPL